MPPPGTCSRRSTRQPGSCRRTCRRRRPTGRPTRPTRRSSFWRCTPTCCRSPRWTTTPRTSSRSRCRRSRASAGQVGGQAKPAVRVQVDPAKLAALGLQLTDIAARSTSRASMRRRAPSTARHTYTIYDNDQLTQAAPWNDVIIAYRNGAPIRIATSARRWMDRRTCSRAAGVGARLEARAPRRQLQVFKQPGANVISTVDRGQGAAAQGNASVPPSIKVDADRRPHDHDPRVAADVELTLLIASPGRGGDLPVPAQRLGDGDSGRDGAALADRHVRR